MRILAVSAAVALALIMLGSAYVQIEPFASSPARAGSESATASSGSLQDLVAQHPLQWYLDRLNESDYQRAESFLKTLTPAELQQFESESGMSSGSATGQSGAVSSNLTTGCAFFCNYAPWYNYLAIGAGGCAGGALVGGLLTAPAGGIGAAPGCLIGAAALLIGYQFGLASGSSQAANAELQLITLLAGSMRNQLNASESQFNEEEQVLALTQYFLDDAADSAALSQLPNGTWNGPLDMAQSPDPWIVDAFLQQFEYIFGQFWNVTESWLWADYSPGAQYHGGAYNFGSIPGNSLQCYGPGSDCAAGSQAYYAGGLEDTNQMTGVSTYIPLNSSFHLECSGVSGTVALKPVDSKTAGWSWPVSGGAVTATVVDNPEVSDVYMLSPAGDAADCSIAGYGILPIWDGTTPSNSIGVMACSSPPCDPATLSIGGAIYAAGSSRFGVYSGTTPIGGSSGGTMSDNPNNWISDAVTNTSALLHAAQINAQTYWTFLRSLGYTNISQVPADCTIPPPAFSLPPALDDDAQNLTLNQSIALYYAWLGSMATFFDTPPNVTNFCKGHDPYPGPGGGAWGNPSTNITGFIYIPKVQVSSYLNLIPTSNETFSKTSSWTFNGSSPTWLSPTPKWSVTNASRSIQFTGWPALVSDTLTVGAVNAIPSNDPLTMIVFAQSVDLNLIGNGTNVSQNGYTPGYEGMSPGDAIYVTSCSINGVPQPSACHLTYATINETLPNITCPGLRNASGTCQYQATGGGGTVWNPFSALANFLCSIPGISTICSVLGGAGGLGGVLALIGIVVVALVVIWVVFKIIGARGRRDRVTIESPREAT
jgi:hypothetical protein